MALYERIASIHEANQYIPDKNVPGVQYSDEKNPYVTTIQGVNIIITPGEWIIMESDGLHAYPCSDEEFKKRYRKVIPKKEF